MLAPEFTPAGGIGTRSYESARNLVSEGHKVTVLTAMPRRVYEQQRYNDIEVINVSWLASGARFRPWKFILTVLVFSLYGLILARSRRIHFCYSTITHVGIPALAVKKCFGIPYILAVHGMEVAFPTRIGQKWLGLVLNNASAFTILANRQRQSLHNFGIPDERIFVIQEGIDAEKFRPKPKSSAILERYRLCGYHIILTVGRLVKRKGHDMVIQALPRITSEVPNTVYVIVGTGPEEQELKKIAVSQNVEKDVIFTGYVPDSQLPDYYSTCDVFIMPSREIGADIEGFGLVFLEANACGRPVIGGKSGGIGDAIADGVTGFLVNPEDISAISEKVICLLKDASLAEKLGRQGRERVENEFSREVILTKIQTMLRDIGFGISD